MKKEIKVIRARACFVKDCLDVIIEEERKRGRSDTSYPIATEILRNRIMAAGGLRERKKTK
jgi:hypothetical protein